jgi:hypothetical protein
MHCAIGRSFDQEEERFKKSTRDYANVDKAFSVFAASVTIHNHIRTAPGIQPNPYAVAVILTRLVPAC